MKAALDLVVFEPTKAQRDAAMRADVAEREDATLARAPQEHWLAEQDLFLHLAGSQAIPGKCVIPHLAQGRCAVDVHKKAPFSQPGARVTMARRWRKGAAS